MDAICRDGNEVYQVRFTGRKRANFGGGGEIGGWLAGASVRLQFFGIGICEHGVRGWARDSPDRRRLRTCSPHFCIVIRSLYDLYSVSAGLCRFVLDLPGLLVNRLKEGGFGSIVCSQLHPLLQMHAWGCGLLTKLNQTSCGQVCPPQAVSADAWLPGTTNPLNAITRT